MAGDLMPKRPESVKTYSYEELRAKAEAFIQEHHPVRSIPVPIEEIIELRFELDIIPIPDLLHGSDMYALISRDMKSISTDANIQESRPQSYHYSLAHELSHILIHKEVVNQFEYSNIAEWKTVVTGIDEDVYAEFEWQAHALAGLILVPTAQLKAEFGKAAAKIKAAGLTLEQAKATERARFSVEDNLARLFVVPRPVITDRANRDKLWPE
jgi:Zn-dependent peptidase ImmA (M78 family)